jgi:hypothetical protein
MTPRRFPPPWTVIENAGSFWVQDAGGQTVGWFSSATTKRRPADLVGAPGREEAAGRHGFHPPARYGLPLMNPSPTGWSFWTVAGFAANEPVASALKPTAAPGSAGHLRQRPRSWCRPSSAQESARVSRLAKALRRSPPRASTCGMTQRASECHSLACRRGPLAGWVRS